MAEQRILTKDEKEELLIIGDYYRKAIYSNPSVPKILTQFSNDLNALGGEISKTIFSEIIHFNDLVICRDFFSNFRSSLDELYNVLLEELPNTVSFTIECRRKSVKSTTRKVILNYFDRTSINLFDLVAFRIIIDDLDSTEKLKEYCYMVKNICISFFKNKLCILCTPNRQIGSDPLAKDYIEHPKSNGYQSIHLDFMSREKEFFEVQIRTLDMHDLAEHGPAEHKKYKDEAEALVAEYISFDPAKVKIPHFRLLKDHSVYDKIGLHEALHVEFRQKTF